MRKSLLYFSVIFVGILFISRLFYLQVYSNKEYDIFEDNAIRKVFTYPKRGYIFDRNNKLLVSNQPSYDVMIIPREVKTFDTIEFCNLLKIDRDFLIKKYNRTKNYSPRIPQVFLAHLSKEDYGFLSEKIRKFEGFYIQKRNLREYNTNIGANVLGYIAEVNNSIIEKDDYYLMGDLIGKQGVEISYEEELRGIKGIKFIQKDRFNRDVGSFTLQEKAITENTSIFCNNYYQYGKEKRTMQCHCGGGYRNLSNALSLSCNSYFANAYRKTIDTKSPTKETFNNWSNQMKSFGLGEYLNNDLSVGKKGIIPDFEFYNKWYPDFKWGATTTLSNSIGQGEVLVTPIQLANMTAAIANKGYYYTPHIIKKIEGSEINSKFRTKNYTLIDSTHFEPIIEGLSKVYKSGTAKFLQVPDIEICGKTGTAENFTKIDGKKTQLTDHSIFVAFAPKDNPTIAISVLVENGYYGSRWAGRIASLMIEKYIKGEVTLKKMEQLVMNKSLDEEYQNPFLGKPFKINQ